MLYAKKTTLADRVVDLLTFHPVLAFDQILKTLAAVGVVCSFQALYKALASLRSQGVLVVAQKKYSLNTVWVSQVVQAVYFMESNYLSGSKLHQVLLPVVPKQKMTFRFPDLLSMDVFWGHVAVALAVQCPDKPFYFYNPHTWFFVAHMTESRAYFDALKRRRMHNYTVVGAQTSIDKWSAKFHPIDVSEYYCAPKPLFGNKLYLTAIGDYYIVVKIKADMAKKIDDAFSKAVFNVNTENPPAVVGRLFKQRSACTMSISLDSEKAAQFIKRISRYF